jgi:hypothetical protein
MELKESRVRDNECPVTEHTESCIIILNDSFCIILHLMRLRDFVYEKF